MIAPRPIPLPVLESGALSVQSERPPAAPIEARHEGALRDSHGRTIRDLRLSVTDRCGFRCVYCMDPDVRFAPPEALLTAHEIVRIARVGASLGIRRVRLTGGEPTIRPDLLDIIAAVRDACDVELAMTTNGSCADPEAPRTWKRAGLDRVTISIDSLDPERFVWLTRSTCTPTRVLDSIDACLDAGLNPVKVNAVLIRGVNDDEAPTLAALARTRDIEVRFIEYMPLDSGHHWDSSAWVSAGETRAAIERVHALKPIAPRDASQTARVFGFDDGAPGRIGFIAPVSEPFCGACSRLRITADGMVRPCLFSTREWDLRSVLRAGGSDDDLRDFLVDATWTKQPGHSIATPGFRQPDRPMSAIGG